MRSTTTLCKLQYSGSGHPRTDCNPVWKRSVLTMAIWAMFICLLNAQLPEGVYRSTPDGDRQPLRELKVIGSYLVYTEYHMDPPAFINTYGGFYSHENDSVQLNLEFSSSFERDSVRSITVPVKIAPGTLIWGTNSRVLTARPGVQQPLDGSWLFATRGPDTGQERRGEDVSRKTLKFLLDGRFQWIAYDTESMRFSGTGGGGYKAKGGNYTEEIEFFSRDNERVGAQLEFDYEIQGSDWHHKGLNSRGEPMYEIWARREVK